jgi:hypothetical protein
MRQVTQKRSIKIQLMPHAEIQMIKITSVTHTTAITFLRYALEFLLATFLNLIDLMLKKCL